MSSPPASVLLNRLISHARFRHLQALVRVAEFGSIKRAAKAIGMTQPAVTYLLADLEALLEAPLFHRHPRGVRPTPLCDSLLPLAHRILVMLGDSADAVAANANKHAPIVRLLASPAAISGLLAHALPAFTQAYPKIYVQLLEATVDLLATAPARSDIDIICRRQLVPDQLVPVPHGWNFEPLVPDRLVVVCGPEHPLTRRRRLVVGDLRNETWLPLPMETGARPRFDELMMRHGISPRTCPIVSTAPAMVWAMVTKQRLIAMVPFSVVRPLIEADQMKTLPLAETPPFGSLGVMHRSEDSGKAAMLLAAFLRDFAQAHP
jgi:DNA-binding transcriptional LysR family regulator